MLPLQIGFPFLQSFFLNKRQTGISWILKAVLIWTCSRLLPLNWKENG
jgi:hypothetical protein